MADMDRPAADYESVLADLNECKRLKAWRRVPALEAELERLRPHRVELAQDSYYYGTAADFDAQHLSIAQADLAALLDEDERAHDGGPVGTARYTIR